MYIADVLKVDSSGRITISGLLNSSTPKYVVPLVDTEEKTLLLEYDTDNAEWADGLRRRVDDKKRVQLPIWIVEELGEEFYVGSKSGNAQNFGELYPKKYYPHFPL